MDLHDSPAVVGWSGCIAQEVSENSCDASASGLRRPFLILRTDSDIFRNATGLVGRRAADFAVLVHGADALVVIEVKGRSYDVTEAFEQLQNVIGAMVQELPHCRVYPVVFARDHDPITKKMWGPRKIKVALKRIPVSLRGCGDRIVSVHPSVLG